MTDAMTAIPIDEEQIRNIPFGKGGRRLLFLDVLAGRGL